MNKEEINSQYETKANKVFPFIGKNRVVILEKGLYTKKVANYRGISYIHDPQTNNYKTILIGYYNVPDNYVIVPEGMEISEGKQALINKYANKGYIVVDKCPSLSPLSFSEDSIEHKAAVESYNKFKNRL